MNYASLTKDNTKELIRHTVHAWRGKEYYVWYTFTTGENAIHQMNGQPLEKTFASRLCEQTSCLSAWFIYIWCMQVCVWIILYL